MLKSVKKTFAKFQNNHSKLITELFTVAVHEGLNKTEFLQRVGSCQGNLDWRQGKVMEMSGNFVFFQSV